MTAPQEYTFARYLSSKKSVDDRGLNKNVWQALQEALRSRNVDRPRILELGSGIGTMVERVIDWGLIDQADYFAVDSQPDNTKEVFSRIPEWASERGFQVSTTKDTIRLTRKDKQTDISPITADVLDFMHLPENAGSWDLLIANAFLDLVDVPLILPDLLAMLKPGGIFYFTINFDGATIIQPEIDPDLDTLIENLYHRTMDERIIGGKASGDSQTGRHFFQHASHAGAQILESGASDWVVFARQGKYPEDEAYFLHFIVHTIGLALHDNPELDQKRFNSWLSQRHDQIDRGTLVYIAHQMDFLGYKI
ncbi:class I SAM-dependent methyltransferase [Desulfomonile tiedjei]|uniref:Methyltransferase family protein n=1 Tax=Desulfomonile tiedjei (strain ATCC 49306 / DSM 6799 / DCB-1) TaxID=706587 RepID=I4C7W6_DESTA|nr:class I SAM-dependent methyltransferase [Desulfomonile tiedjei]AFM25657.1 methyltransferase family protein [Desulfomonile tiedjei DSM 6799]